MVVVQTVLQREHEGVLLRRRVQEKAMRRVFGAEEHQRAERDGERRRPHVREREGGHQRDREREQHGVASVPQERRQHAA